MILNDNMQAKAAAQTAIEYVVNHLRLGIQVGNVIHVEATFSDGEVFFNKGRHVFLVYLWNFLIMFLTEVITIWALLILW